MLVLLASLFIAANPMTNLELTPTGDSIVFAGLKAREGIWEGTYRWDGRDARGTARIVYSLTGNSSVVVERIYMDGDAQPSMTSMYYLDEGRLTVTHFCAAGNQPRLRLQSAWGGSQSARFDFLDGTNLTTRPHHVVAIEMAQVNSDMTELAFTFASGSNRAVERFQVARPTRGSD